MNLRAPKREDAVDDRLDLPAYPFQMRTTGTRAEIFDEVRRLWVRLTPEEWVRQHVARMLIQKHGVTPARLAVEKGFLYLGQPRRADLVVYDRQGHARLLVECKASSVALSQATFEQVARYNQVLGADVILVTNGRQHFVYRVVPGPAPFVFLSELPPLREEG